MRIVGTAYVNADVGNACYELRVGDHADRGGVEHDIVVVFFNSSMASSRDLRANSSVGLGGIVPPGRMLRLADRSEDCIMLRRSVLCGATRYWVIPRSLCEIWNTLFNPGLRISSPTMTTFLPNSAKLTARLEAMKVFPSATCGGGDENYFLVRVAQHEKQVGAQAAESLCHDVVVVFADGDGVLFIGVVQGNIADNRNTRKSLDIRMSLRCGS